MRILSYILLSLVVFFSLASWKTKSDLSERLCADLSQPNPKIVQVGGGWFLVKGGMRNQNPEVCEAVHCQKLFADVFIPMDKREDTLPKTIVGNFMCAPKAHNPSQYFFLRFFKRPVLIAKKFRIVEFETSPNFIDRFSWENQKEFPLLNALVESVWKGTTQSFPEDFIQFYRRGGLSHILAVSGTHVVILYYLMNKLFGVFLFFAPWLFRKNRIWFVRTFLLLLSALTLWKYSPGNAPVHRSLFFLLTIGVLNLKMWKADPVQMVCSGLAFLLLFEPNLFLSESFWLSALGALFLSIRAQENILKTYLWGVLLIPLLMAPVVSFVFGQLSLLSPLFSLFFSPLWDVVLIPVGYISPLIGMYNAMHWILGFFERFLRFVSTCQTLLYPLTDISQVVTFRPSLTVTIVLSICLVLLVIIATHFRQKTL